MELHKAIKQLIAEQGKDFLFSDAFVNALADFQAFEEYPSTKNILRLLCADGYVGRLIDCGDWNIKAQALAQRFANDYSITSNMAEYAFQSIAFGLGFLKNITPTVEQANNNESKISSIVDINNDELQSLTWDKQKTERFLQKATSVDEHSFNFWGLKTENLSVTTRQFDTGTCIVNPLKYTVYEVQFEIKGVLKDMLSVNVYCTDNSGKTIPTVHSECILDRKKFKGHLSCKVFFDTMIDLSQVDKLTVRAEECSNLLDKEPATPELCNISVHPSFKLITGLDVSNIRSGTYKQYPLIINCTVSGNIQADSHVLLLEFGKDGVDTLYSGKTVGKTEYLRLSDAEDYIQGKTLVYYDSEEFRDSKYLIKAYKS